MDRRQFTTQLLCSLGAVLPGLIKPIPLSSSKRFAKMKKPKRLQSGDTVALIAPGSPITQDKLDKSIANMEALGLTVKYHPDILAKEGYLAGSDKQRLEDIHNSFADGTVKAIWCVRGGYGCTRLLPEIDFKFIKKNPKILIGYSDVTALLGAVCERTNLVCFHGPMTASTLTPFALEHLKAVLMEARDQLVVDPKQLDNEQYSISSGTASGFITGGNLSLMAAMTGTKYQMHFKNKIVFIEDIGEKPYRIDRMLTQLLQGSDLSKAAAIVLGVFEDCEAKEGENSFTLKETLQDRLGNLGIPVYYGFPTGHINNQCTLPIGGMAHFDGHSGILTLTEASVL